MHYYSTRNKEGYTTAANTIKKGLAPDGGLYVPAEIATPFKTDNLPTGHYRDIAYTILKIFLTDYSSAQIENAVNSAYNSENFDHPDVTPLCKLTNDLFVLELWHGPTYAFKDVALQILPFLMRAAMDNTGEKSEIVILAATSGDTGKSALEGFRDVNDTKIIAYFPEKGISEIQKLQMITQEGNNLDVAAVRGNFDDTQTGVKKLFNDHILAEKLVKAGFRLSSANSINWGRLLPQIVYYFSTYSGLVSRKELAPGEKINFVVPTGNFGNILAGYYAHRLGLPINRLICASNRNNVLSGFINSGRYSARRPLQTTLSPSMDILISSNLERLLFELTGHDTGIINSWMTQLKDYGEYIIDTKTLQKLQELFWADFADDEETMHFIRETYQNHNYLIDTHTAVGMSVHNKYRNREEDSCLSVLLSTASPYKFSGSVSRALFGDCRFKNRSELELLKILSHETGIPIPANLADINHKPIRHKQVIKPAKIDDHLLSFLNLQ
ncbi:MAG: threonine synthase [Bacillota bacterium]